MGVQYYLVNQTKKEMITFAHLSGSKKRELAGNGPQSAIVTWYLLENQGDKIQFVSDTYNEWPFESGCIDDLSNYPDQTDQVVSDLIDQGVLEDNGMLFVDDEEPDRVYERDIKIVWAK